VRRTFLFWDVDGTLLDTARAGIFAWEEAIREVLGEKPAGEQMVVIGDTPHDVSCGKAIGARTLAVATGTGYDLDALRACEPWAALAELPMPEELAALLRL
jgi:phosphoglycolate phosphatase-like HAD superfamily hydrolase